MTEFDGLDESTAARFAKLALSCVHLEYPNGLHHVMGGKEDLGTPSELTPVFYGCFDWHSSVHGHWMLIRLTRQFPEAAFAQETRVALNRSFTEAGVSEEVAYMSASGRGSWERPYGLAWFLQLMAELHQWEDSDAARWASLLAPLEELVVSRLMDWFPKLVYPIRTGEHSQTAFAMGLIHDYANIKGHSALRELIEERSKTYYLNDRGASFRFEPGGQDFLSPILAEADLMRRVLNPDEYMGWLELFLPEWQVSETLQLPVARVTDRSDGKLAHLDGLNLSRAWMLDGIMSALPSDDARRSTLKTMMDEHSRSGLASVTGEHYEGGHWLGSFAVYLTSRRGVSQ